MSTRIRKPSAKLLEIAGQYAASSHSMLPPPVPASPSQKPKKKGTSTTTNAAGQRKSSTTAGKSTAGPQKPAKKAAATQFEGPGQDGHRLYCICLGTDDQTPMIQCEGCENWFHFRCIELSAKEARKIKSYFCEICTEVGAGVTTKIQQNVARTSMSTSSRPELLPESSGSEGDGMQSDGGNYQDHLSGPDNSTDTENSDSEAALLKKQAAQHRQKMSTSSTSKKRKLKRAEGFEDSGGDSEDNDYPGEGDVEVEPRQKRVPKPKRQVSGSGRRDTYYGSNANVSAEVERTRQTCITQLVKTLDPIFTEAASADEMEGAAEKTQAFVAAMEEEMFEQFAEIDPKLGGPRQAKQKYLNKLRQLLFNLKKNDIFRNRVATGQLDAVETVNISPEDLMSAQQKALAENVRAKSLKESVKTATEAPKLKRTHKGEEVVDEFMTLDTTATFVKPSAPAGLDHAVSEDAVAQPFPSPEPASPIASKEAQAAFPERKHLRSPSAPFRTGAGESYLVDAEDVGFRASKDASMSPQRQESAIPLDAPSVAPLADTTSTDEDVKSATTPQSPPKASFDFDSVWGAFKTPTTPRVGQDSEIEAIPGAKDEGNDVDMAIDPFGGLKRRGKDDMDLDDILRDEDKPAISTTPKGSPKAPEVSIAPSKKVQQSEVIRNLPAIWSGDVLMPDEGGYPAIAVQVGGRPLGSALALWQTLLPDTVNMTGRIPASSAAEYLLKCTLTQSRELIVVALLPDMSGPNVINPTKPTAERTVSKMNHLVNYFTSRERNGVCPPAEDRRKVVKDVYIVPLRSSDAVPEYIECLDHSLGDLNDRDADLLLAVMVLQKGAVSAQSFAPPSSTNRSPFGVHGVPSFSPPVSQPSSGLQQSIDADALQSLLSQPSLLANILASQQAPLQPQQQAPSAFPNHEMLQNLASNPSLVQSLLANNNNNNSQQGDSRNNYANPPPYSSGPYMNPDRQRLHRNPRSRSRSRSRSPPGRRSFSNSDRRFSRDEQRRDDFRREQDQGWSRRSRR